MKNEYEELPAFETNEFKVDDFVHVYWGDMVYAGRIHYISEGKFIVLRAHSGVYHYKQCRLLKKREPRVLWLPPGFFNGWDLCKTIAREPREGWIKVQEVFEEE